MVPHPVVAVVGILAVAYVHASTCSTPASGMWRWRKVINSGTSQSNGADANNGDGYIVISIPILKSVRIRILFFTHYIRLTKCIYDH